jgi:hypothetical protein
MGAASLFCPLKRQFQRERFVMLYLIGWQAQAATLYHFRMVIVI